MTEQVNAPVAEFTATFSYKVNGIRTATVGNRAGVVKQIDWVLVGEESGQKFELPQTITLADPADGPFIELANLTEAKVIEWIQASDTRIPSIKAHIQQVLTKEVAKATLSTTPMPWAPVVEQPTV